MMTSFKFLEFPFGRYSTLIIVAVLSLLPFFYMISVSFMSLGQSDATDLAAPSGWTEIIAERTC